MRTIFQIYPKGLPDHGECLRFEGQYVSKYKKNLKDSISGMITNGDYMNNSNETENEYDNSKKTPFETAEYILKKSRK